MWLVVPFLLLLQGASAAFETIAGYEPFTQVTDPNAMDLDVQVLKQRLEAQLFESAADVYSQGGHSLSTAEITLVSPLLLNLDQGTPVTGVSPTGSEVIGYVAEETFAFSTILRVRYSTSDSQADYAGCRVGGLPLVTVAVTDGCFVDSGVVTVGDVNSELQYAYSVFTDNNNGRTLQSFSLEAQARYSDCGVFCPYDEYQKFINYYGSFNYADIFVQSAFQKSVTSLERGNVDFTGVTAEFQSDFIQDAVVMMHLLMKVVGDMEDAIVECAGNCVTECNDDLTNSWDRSVAFYTGSLEGPSGNGDGLLMYELADKECVFFNTCVSGTAGTSNVNTEVMQLFTVGQAEIRAGTCGEARGEKNRITQLMMIPIIQQTLRRAKAGQLLSGSTADAQGIAASASIVPFVHACSQEDAQIIHDNMQLAFPNHAAVKEAFERNYACLGITCAEVGGLFSPDTMTYATGTEPCQDNPVTAPVAPPTSSPVMPVPVPTPPPPTTASPVAPPTNAPAEPSLAPVLPTLAPVAMTEMPSAATAAPIDVTAMPVSASPVMPPTTALPSSVPSNTPSGMPSSAPVAPTVPTPAPAEPTIPPVVTPTITPPSSVPSNAPSASPKPSGIIVGASFFPSLYPSGTPSSLPSDIPSSPAPTAFEFPTDQSPPSGGTTLCSVSVLVSVLGALCYLF